MPDCLRLATFNSPRRVIVGTNASEEVSNELELEKGKRVLIVTDEGVKNIGIPKKIISHLEDEGLLVDLYYNVEPDPHIEGAMDIAEKVREGDFDAVIGLGGGSSMDTAKVASFSVANPRNINKYLGRGLIERRGLPLICLPTTAGTGSEVTRVSVFSVGKVKRFFVSHHIVPDIAIVDPKLTVTMPPKITAGSGMDALSHAVEGVLSSFATPLTQSIALEAIRLISNNLRVAYHNGRNIEARHNMSLAATMAGLSFNDPGVVHGHSIAQTFSPLYGIPHGLSCAMTLPYIMSFYRPVCPDRLAQIATAMEVDTIGLSEREVAEAAIIEVHELNEDLDIPSLREYGVEEEKLPEIARDCVKYWVRANSPRLLTEKAALQILEDMWSEI